MLLTCTALLVAGCGDGGGGSSGSAGGLPLEGTTWTVEAIDAADGRRPAPSGATATLVFDGDGTVQVRPGCNTGTGTYRVTGDTLVVSDLVTTLMACDGARGELEDAVLAVLRADALRWTVEGDRLTLSAGDDGLRLVGAAQG